MFRNIFLLKEEEYRLKQAEKINQEYKNSPAIIFRRKMKNGLIV
jgi:hypothetical protein